MFLVLLFGCNKDIIPTKELSVAKYQINDSDQTNYRNCNLSPEIKIKFTTPIDTTSAMEKLKIYDQYQINNFTIHFIDGDSTMIISFITPLNYLTKYYLFIESGLKAKNGKLLPDRFQASFTTLIDNKDKYSRIADDDLLTLIQKQTFKYFWDFGHPVSGLARERNSSGDLVTSGGSGFGIMALIVGIERGFITRQEGIDRLKTITNFLLNKADRFHGVFPHWFSGTTGKTIPFSTKDNGGDLVETSYLLAGLISAKEYFTDSNQDETQIRQNIQQIWESVEWSWYTKNGEKVLYWHWSPTYQWDMNFKISGYDEALITYIMAASSPTHTISKEVYTQGWALNGGIKNGKSFYGFELPVGYDYGGPLFFAHYSFLGIDPHGLSDQYADYWTQVVNHSKINHAYCKDNPKSYFGYSGQCWGLTASDSNNGYNAHSPTNDLGVISPTAALSSLPYTPEQSIDAMKYFYYILGDKTFKEYGFIDAFNLHNLWFADSFLAIDQGPIIVMIENYRTGLIWKLLIKSDDVRSGLTKLGFHSSVYGF